MTTLMDDHSSTANSSSKKRQPQQQRQQPGLYKSILRSAMGANTSKELEYLFQEDEDDLSYASSLLTRSSESASSSVVSASSSSFRRLLKGTGISSLSITTPSIPTKFNLTTTDEHSSQEHDEDDDVDTSHHDSDSALFHVPAEQHVSRSSRSQQQEQAQAQAQAQVEELDTSPTDETPSSDLNDEGYLPFSTPSPRQTNNNRSQIPTPYSTRSTPPISNMTPSSRYGQRYGGGGGGLGSSSASPKNKNRSSPSSSPSDLQQQVDELHQRRAQHRMHNTSTPTPLRTPTPTSRASSPTKIPKPSPTSVERRQQEWKDLQDQLQSVLAENTTLQQQSLQSRQELQHCQQQHQNLESKYQHDQLAWQSQMDIIAAANNVSDERVEVVSSDDDNSQIERLQVQLELEVERRTRAEDACQTVQKELHTLQTQVAPQLIRMAQLRDMKTAHEQEVKQLELKWKTRQNECQSQLETAQQQVKKWKDTSLELTKGIGTEISSRKHHEAEALELSSQLLILKSHHAEQMIDYSGKCDDWKSKWQEKNNEYQELQTNHDHSQQQWQAQLEELEILEQEHNAVIEELQTELQELDAKYARDKNLQEQQLVVATKSSHLDHYDDDDDKDDEWQRKVENKRMQRLEEQLLEQEERHLEEKAKLQILLDAALCLQQEQQQQQQQQVENKRIQRLEGQLLEQEERHLEEKANLQIQLDAALCSQQQQQQQQQTDSIPPAFGGEEQQPFDEIQNESKTTSQDPHAPFFRFGGDLSPIPKQTPSKTGLHVFGLEEESLDYSSIHSLGDDYSTKNDTEDLDQKLDELIFDLGQDAQERTMVLEGLANKKDKSQDQDEALPEVGEAESDQLLEEDTEGGDEQEDEDKDTSQSIELVAQDASNQLLCDTSNDLSDEPPIPLETPLSQYDDEGESETDKYLNETGGSSHLHQTLTVLQNLTNMMHGRGEVDNDRSSLVIEHLEALSEMMDEADREFHMQNTSQTSLHMQNTSQTSLALLKSSERSALMSPSKSTRSTRTSSEDNPWPVLVEELRSRCHFLEADRTELARITKEMIEMERESHRLETNAAVATAKREASAELNMFRVQTSAQVKNLYRTLCVKCQHRIYTAT
jgi:hypothetical protein